MRPLDPYRVLFPLGVLFAVAGTALWPLHATGLIPYPGPLHWTWMIQGFQHCFILGFLMTALPSFMHAERCHPIELAVTVAALLAFGAFSAAGRAAPANGAYLLTLLLLPVMAGRRLRKGGSPPPEEFLLVGLGVLLGIAGGLLSMGAAAGWWVEPAPRFGLRLISMGMVLSLVLGVGGLLVPTFSAMREPLVIPGLARPHERGPRRILYAALGAGLVLALMLEAAGRASTGAWVRAGVAAIMLLWVWKLPRLPGARDTVAYTIWSAGWLLLAGIATVAVRPDRPLLGFHLAFVGGLGLLTLGIATRVVVRHGGHKLSVEPRVLNPLVHAAVALALVARLAAELSSVRSATLLAVSGSAWGIAWAIWGAGALPRILRRSAPAVPLRPAGGPAPAP